MFKVYDMVEIINKNNLHPDLRDDTIGKIENIDGAYILVRLNDSGVIVEVYPNEIRKIIYV